MAVFTSSQRARIHRTIQTVTVAFPAGGLGTSLTLNVTVTAVESPRYLIHQPGGGLEMGASATGNFVESFTLSSTTNLQIIWTRAAAFAGRTEQWAIEEFF